MRPDLARGRRLRFDLEMGDRESIPGAIVRGVRKHVLVRTAPVLASADVRMKHVGLSQLATPDELGRIAYVARCVPEQFAERAGERVYGAGGGKALDARFGRLVMPRAYLELDRRRIGPLTLRKHAYHRLDWMNLLLPYCPASLERLVDTCVACDTPLGWRYARGVGHCDACGQEVAPSDDAGLSEDGTDDYRLFAKLSSPDARGVEEAVGHLPTPIAGIAPASLVRLSLLVGGLVNGEPASASRHTVADLPAPTLASVAMTGVAMLRSWPRGLQDWVGAQSEQLGASPADLERLRTRMRRLVDRQSESPDVIAMVSAALPDLRRHAAHGFSTNRNYYLYKDVQRILGLGSPATEALKRWPGITFLRLNTAGKEQGQFDVEQIDGLVPAFRQTVAINACKGRFGLPLYAVEQLCAGGLLEWEDHAALLAVGSSRQVRTASADRLAATLRKRARKDVMPDECVSLASAARRIGGGPKPWAAILDALRRGVSDSGWSARSRQRARSGCAPRTSPVSKWWPTSQRQRGWSLPRSSVSGMPPRS